MQALECNYFGTIYDVIIQQIKFISTNSKSTGLFDIMVTFVQTTDFNYSGPDSLMLAMR